MAETPQKLSREDVAKLEIGRTTISTSAAWFLMLLFLAIICVVPLVQHAREIRQHRTGARAAWWPQCYDLAGSLRIAWDAGRGGGSWWDRTLRANHALLQEIGQYESTLEDSSWLTHLLLSPAQAVLTRWCGVGNEKAYLGRDRWLFYRPDIEYLTGRGFLDPAQQKKRALSAKPWDDKVLADPLPAILDFRDQLARRNIALILMPVPVKPAVMPGQFAAHYLRHPQIPRNPSHEQFMAELQKNNVLVYDCSALLSSSPSDAGPAYLATDTHWAPAAMARVAADLAAFIRQYVPLPDVPPAGLLREPVPTTGEGDIVTMLKLPADQNLFMRETMTNQQVITAGHELWRAVRGADVLFLGDSFANIFSLPAMGWGESAGLVEQLGWELQRPLDRILRNDNSAYVTRQALAREMAKGSDRLAGKRLVIWEFAMRELAVGDWKKFALDLGAMPEPGGFLAPPAGSNWVITAEIVDAAAVPKPGSVPYKDHIMALHLADVRGDQVPASTPEALVFLWSMRDNQWTPAAALRPGQSVRLRVQPWADVAAHVDGINRSELEDERLLLEEPCWGELLP